MAGEERRTSGLEATPKEKAPIIKTFPLRKPIVAYGATLNNLEFREPTTADIVRCGYPVVIRPMAGGGIQIAPDEDKMTMMIGELATIPPSSVGKLDTRDWSTIQVWLTIFFVPDWDQLREPETK